MSVLIKIYDYFSQHKKLLWGITILFVVLLGVLTATLRYNEDIFDFLPVDDEYHESMEIYTKISDANRIVIIFESQSPDSICTVIDEWAVHVPNSITEVDMMEYIEQLTFVYQNMPYFLTEKDYPKLDTLLTEDNIQRTVQHCRSVLSIPGTSFLYKSFSHDPFQLIPLSRGASGQYAGAQSAFASYNGYMMTADQTLGFAFLDSPYGSTETQNNKALLDSLSNTIHEITSQHPSVDIRLLGAPVVAVENANRIKKDTILIILFSAIAFVFLLLYAFPRRKDILLILLSVAFGALFGTAALAIFAGEVSVIVLGIGAILMGIAINYPLHLLVHQRYTTSVRQTLREVLSPLIVGNISTIGAFLVLLPLQAPALKQLGIFSSSMLLGTILFCVFILPHLMSSTSTIVREIPTPNIPNRCKQILPYILVPLLTILLVIPCVKSGDLFDSNLSNINYMTSQQRKDFAFFESVAPQSNEPTFLVNDARCELERRLELWNQYWKQKDTEHIANAFNQAASSYGFRPTMFAPFLSLITQPYTALDISESDYLAQLWPGKFDTTSMNAKITTALSDNFDYIGIFCSLVVFLFLWMSFRNIILALIAFLPMVVSMGVIVGIMQLTGLQFNIVNVILATFIFGQGDDYTIFVLEGCLYELKTGNKILSQYKQSIILSALIMLIGIGVLIFAKHPAMFSLGIVTLIGMTCVVTMAYFLPPLLLQAVCHSTKIRKYILKER